MDGTASPGLLGQKSFQAPRAQPLGELRVLLFDEEQYYREGTLRQEVRGEACPERAQAFCPRDRGQGVPRAAVSRLLAGFLLFRRALRCGRLASISQQNQKVVFSRD